MRRFLATTALSLVSLNAWAIPFAGTYDVSVNTQDPGLEIDVTPDSGVLAFDIDAGEQTGWLSLFRISTPESWVNSDDLVPMAASVDFNFVVPTAFGGTSSGSTTGVSLFYGLWQQGQLTWANGGLNSLYFAGGILDVFLQDTSFGGQFGGLNDDPGVVKAKFAYRPGVAVVSEPTTLALLGAGFLIVALWRRRSSNARR